MKKLLFLLLLLNLGFAGLTTAAARPNPKAKPKRAFAHNAEASKDKTSRVQFRREAIHPVVDLTPHKIEKFKTAKANKPYKYAKAR